jgi:isopenicillin-N epimerase
LREEFLCDPSVTFLNHGSFGATPRAVFERYREWQLELERQPVLFLARRLDGLLAPAVALGTPQVTVSVLRNQEQLIRV